MTEQSIVVSAHDRAVTGVKLLANIVHTLYSDVMKVDIDFGVIPGTGTKPTLLLPGMEKLMRALELRPDYVERRSIIDFDKGLFYFQYECQLIEIDTGRIVASAIGSANSQETKWAGRWVSRHEVPPNLNADTLPQQGGRISEFTFAVDKAETTGQYGKPADYWQAFKDGIADGSAVKIKRADRKGVERDAWEIDSTKYRIPNTAIADQLNTIDKIAQKRALSSAIKGAANVSELFTVDLEDLADYVVTNAPTPAPALPGVTVMVEVDTRVDKLPDVIGTVVEVVGTVVEEPKKAEKPKAKPAAAALMKPPAPAPVAQTDDEPPPLDADPDDDESYGYDIDGDDEPEPTLDVVFIKAVQVDIMQKVVLVTTHTGEIIKTPSRQPFIDAKYDVDAWKEERKFFDPPIPATLARAVDKNGCRVLTLSKKL